MLLLLRRRPFKDKVYPLSIPSWHLILLSAFDVIRSLEGSVRGSSLITFIAGLFFLRIRFIPFGALIQLVLRFDWHLVVQSDVLLLFLLPRQFS